MSCCCGILFDCYDFHDFPIDAVGVEQMRIEFGYISDFIDFQFKYGIVVVNKTGDKEFFILITNFTKPLRKQPKKILINPLHHTTLQNHINKLTFIPLRNIHLHNLMRTFFITNRRLYRQIYSSS